MENVTVKEVSMEDLNWERIYEYFYGYSHIDIHNIPENFQDYVIPMLELLKKEAIVRIKYGVTDIHLKEIDRIVLEEDVSFSGPMISKVYRDAKKVILYVMSITNIGKLLEDHSDLMETYFLEYWATSILNSLRKEYYEIFRNSLIDDKHKLSSVWSPGNSRFDLSNQEAIFKLLKPEEIGLILDRHLNMIPLKSVSGTIGILPAESTDDYVSCDFCQFAKTCPSYNGKKYNGICMNNRHI